MLGEYKVSRCTRQCHGLGRPLREGEWYYSVVLESDDQYVRRDYSAESWQGPPEGTIGWWKNRMPTSDEKKLVLAPPEVLIDLLRQMGDVAGKEKSRYLLALMLMRRRIVKPAKPESDSERTAVAPDQTAQAESTIGETGSVDADGPKEAVQEVLRVQVPADGTIIEVPICQINRSESDAVKDELNELLYCEAEEE